MGAPAGAPMVLLRLPGHAATGARPTLPPETAALLRALRRGRGGGLFPGVARLAPDGLLEPVRVLGAADVPALARALSQPAFRPWVDMIETLGAWCRAQQREHADLFRPYVLRPGNADLFAPLVGGAFVRCAIGGAGCGDDVDRACRDFRAFFERFAGRLRRDLDGGTFRGDVAGPVAAIRAAASETHNGGQRVLCLRMHGGLRIAYKPRPVDGEHVFLASGDGADAQGDASIFEWLNGLPGGSGPVRLPTLRVWRGSGRDRRAYSWQEWIEPPKQRGRLRVGARSIDVPTLAPRAAAAYWRSAGALAVACHAFGITDLGDGNLMAGRRQGVRGVLPHIVDLEIFACPLQRLSGTGLVEPAMHRGRTHPGFPDRPRADEAEGPAVAFFGTPGGGLSLRRVDAPWVRRDSRTVIADTMGNVGYAAYLLPMLRGMFDLWTRMGLNRERLLARLRVRSRSGRVRVLAAYTATYARELERALLPGEGTQAPSSRRFSAEERAQLARGDVPYFFASAAGGPLYWMAGPGARHVREAGPQAFEEPSLLPDPAMLEGRNLAFVGLAVPIQDVIAYVCPQLLSGPELLRDKDGLRLRDPALGVDVRIRDEATGSASFDWPSIGRRVTFSWSATRIGVDTGPLPAARPRARSVATRLLRIDRVDAPLRAAWAVGGFRDRDAGRQLAALTGAGLEWLGQVLVRDSWPTEAMVGRAASRSASRLAQHAGRDALALQRRCLQAMRDAAALGEVPLREVAYLTDAVRINEGRPQVYGTKFRKWRGRLHPCPLEEPAAVDERRRAMGLGPLADYRRILERRYGRRGTGRP